MTTALPPPLAPAEGEHILRIEGVSKTYKARGNAPAVTALEPVDLVGRTLVAA